MHHLFVWTKMRLSLRSVTSTKVCKNEPSHTTLLFYQGIALVETDQKVEGCRCLTKAFNAGIDDVGEYLKEYCYK